jgi:hypothetical protein
MPGPETHRLDPWNLMLTPDGHALPVEVSKNWPIRAGGPQLCPPSAVESTSSVQL